MTKLFRKTSLTVGGILCVHYSSFFLLIITWIDSSFLFAYKIKCFLALLLIIVATDVLCVAIEAFTKKHFDLLFIWTEQKICSENKNT